MLATKWELKNHLRCVFHQGEKIFNILTYNHTKCLHRVPIFNLYFHLDYLTPFCFFLLPKTLKFNLSGTKSSKAYSSVESVLCSFSSSFSDFSFLRMLGMKSFSPWLCVPISCFRWRGSLPIFCPASRLGWSQTPYYPTL